MEHTLYITNLQDLEYFTESYSRIYFGTEFCQNLIPHQKELELVLKFVENHSISFSLVTPYVTDKGLQKLIPLFSYISDKIGSSEVIFNDWGVFNVIKHQFPQLKPVLGRLLTKIKRDPRIIYLREKISSNTWNYFRTTNLNIPWYREFLKNNGIERIDLDNPLQGINLNFPDFHKSLYFPYGHITTTRLCLTANCDQPEDWDRIGIFPCHRECQHYTFYLQNNVMPVKLIRKGNTIFYQNEKILSDQHDRLVYQPKIPI
ncbi:MAG: hypothetical protein ACTSYB_12725 [Candidatus Helarchaeota archaeon]